MAPRFERNIMKFEEAKETKDKSYRTWLYFKNENGEIVSDVFGIDDAIIKTANEGWRLSPAEFSEDETLVDDPQFNQVCDELARDRNMILNLEAIEDKSAIEALLERMFGVSVRSDMKIENMRKRVIKEARLKGIEGV